MDFMKRIRFSIAFTFLYCENKKPVFFENAWALFESNVLYILKKIYNNYL